MRKTILCAVVVALIAAHTGQAAVGLAQRFEIGARNHVAWAGGIGSAVGVKQVAVNQRQARAGTWPRVSAVQRERARLNQSATVTGLYPGRVEQTADVKGLQRLLVSGGPRFASGGQQRLAGEFRMVAQRPWGLGSASGSQTFMGEQAQIIQTPYSTTTQSQRMKVRQYSSIDTQGPIDPLVRNTVNVRLDQRQVETGRIAPVPMSYDP